MIGKPMTKLVIVCGEHEKKYGNYLRQLICTNDDKEGETIGVEDGTVDVAVWSEEEYKSNSPTISSSVYLLFIGENKASKSEVVSMPIVFNRFGMKYGWRGKRGMLIVDKVLTNAELINEFNIFTQQFESIGQIDDENTLNAERDAKLKKIAIIGSHVLLPGSGFAVKKKMQMDEMKNKQYYALTTTFYLEGIQEFLKQ